MSMFGSIGDALVGGLGKAAHFTLNSGSTSQGRVTAEKNIMVTTGKNSGSTTSGKPMFKYPLTVEEGQHTSKLAFNATNVIQGNESSSERTGLFGNLKTVKSTNIGSVFLYMPEIETAYTQNYTDDGRGLLWVLANAVQNNGGVNQLMGKAGIEAARAGLAYEAAKHAPNLIKDFTRQVYNQHNAANFTGTQLRRQKFTFDLRPRNSKELVHIAGMLEFFKANAASDLIGESWLSVPSRWYIEEMPSSNSSRAIPLFRFGPAFLTNIEVDYTPDGSWKTFENGDPIAIKLTLEFMENSIVTRKDITDASIAL